MQEGLEGDAPARMSPFSSRGRAVTNPPTLRLGCVELYLLQNVRPVQLAPAS